MNLDPQLLNHPDALQEPPSLPILVESARQLWGSARLVDADRYPGVKTRFDEETGHAIFSSEQGRAMSDVLHIYPDSQGTWILEMKTKRPSLETEGIGVIEVNTRYPLLADGHVTTDIKSGWDHADGHLSHEMHAGEGAQQPMNENICQRLQKSLNLIGGEKKETTAPPRRGRFSLSKWIAALSERWFSPYDFDL